MFSSFKRKVCAEVLFKEAFMKIFTWQIEKIMKHKKPP